MYLIIIALLASVSAFPLPNLEDYCRNSYCYLTVGHRMFTDKKATKLTEFHMDSCEKKVLQLMPNLRTLELENCSSPDFTMNDLNQLPYLTSLQLRRGNLLELHDEHFAKWPNMKILVLGGNNITRLSNDCFKGLAQLWLLSLPGNGIQGLPWDVFQNLPELLHLDLSGNRIETLHENSFSGVPKLEMLLLNRNPLIWISPESLQSLSNLRLLDMSNCRPLPDLSLPGAHTLILENSGVQRLDILGSVHKLQARNNHITDIKLPDKSSVIELDLHSNLLTATDIPKLLMGMWRLQRLDLSENLIGKYAAALSDNTSELFMLPNLMHMNLSGNRLMHLPFDSPIPWERLTHLDVSYNRIYAPPRVGINEAFNLQNLHLEGNSINYFQFTTWKPHPSLKEVALYDNNFKPEDYKNITKFFNKIGVNVLEKMNSNNASPTCMPCIARDFPTSIRPDTNQEIDTDIQVNPLSNDTYQNWNVWHVLMLVSLIVSLCLNSFLIVQLIRLRGRNQFTQSSSEPALIEMPSNYSDDVIML
ncbi:insulin-like growth factor-binding protein complex acid labile subunit [Drosophila simulans]|uniref:GD18519 n=1 Tax=Drosophila simulans TaxID=7240 RepID=B4QYP5_DROSI|nr:insulin-like growth factor-binding protein complex acid labile subunit [Drosophila simulans]EDX13803.1 GD18519 [Drosophila simulans]KMZ04948.1 uncharacterized protein Dsimw501_GD18519 [Drosophila simulans]